jgi:cobalt-zinc-cadmium efflux system protein
VGLAANLAAAYVLMGGRDNLNVEGVFLHLLADAAGSIAAVALGVALLFTDLLWLDPLFSVLIALLVLYSAKDLLRESVNILMQGAPPSVDVEEVATALLDIEGVSEIHDVHVWALTPERHACSVHVVVTKTADHDAVLETARTTLGERFDVGHATVQIERPDGRCETADFDCYTAETV